MRNSSLLSASRFIVMMLPVLFSSALANDPYIEHTEVRGGVTFIRAESPIGNQSSVIYQGQKEALMIEANIKSIFPLIMNEFFEKDGAPELRYVVTSHHHRDHTDALSILPEGVIAIAPEKQDARLHDGAPEEKSRLTFKKALTLHVDDETIRIFTPPNTNAHTEGDAFIYFEKAKVLYVGDHYFMDRFPLIDTVNGGGSIEGYFANLNWVIDTFDDDIIVLGGHGTFQPKPIKLSTKTDYAEWVSTLEESVKIVKKAVKKGKTQEALIEEGLGGKFDYLSEKPRYQPEERWIKLLYSELGAKSEN